MRVLDLSRLFPGPYCTSILADLGFEVIKIESPSGGDWLRHLPPLAEDGLGLLFHALNRGKKSLTLNLKASQGREAFLRLVETADVLLESFRPGVMERLALDYDVLSRANPRLVYCSLSGYGQRGPYRDVAGHDLNYVALSGLLDLTGPREGPPAVPGAQVADVSGALWAAIGILWALVERDRTGWGQRVETSLLGGALSCLTLAVVHQQGHQTWRRGASDLTGGWVCYHVYQARDGGYMALAALEPEFWAAFCAAVGRQDLVECQFAPAQPGEPAYEALCSLFRSRTREEWAKTLAGCDACCTPTYSIAEALESEPIRALGLVAEPGILPPLQLSGRSIRPAGPAPVLGQHTAALLGELGYSDSAIQDLRGRGVV